MSEIQPRIDSVSSAQQSPYSYNDCINALAQYHEERKEIPTRSGYQLWCVGRAVPSTDVILRHLATGNGRKKVWSKVLKVCGFTLKCAKKQRSVRSSSFSAADCINSLASCRAKFGRAPMQIEYERWRKEQGLHPSALTVVRLGDPKYPKKQRWHAAIKVFGLNPKEIPSRKKVRPGVPRSKPELGSFLLCCSQELGEVPSSYSYDRWREELLAAGEDAPTQTTLRRRLGGDSWNSTLKFVGLDPGLISARSKAERENELKERCLSSLKKFVEYFSGLAPLAVYLRWSMLDTNRSSITSLLNWLAPERRSWEEAIQNAALADSVRLTTEEAMSRNGELPTIATREECILAVRNFVLERSVRPSYPAYRQWRINKNVEGNSPPIPSEAEIIFQLSPERWSWVLALDAALA